METAVPKLGLGIWEKTGGRGRGQGHEVLAGLQAEIRGSNSKCCILDGFGRRRGEKRHER